MRFSSLPQGTGDSIRRQTLARDAWCLKNKVHLDESTTLHDLGKSAFRGEHKKNPDRHALAGFLEMVKAGKVPRGSYLIVEALDRLTHEDIQPALMLILGLLQDGIHVVQLSPHEAIYTDKSGPHEVMLMVVELMRGNSESARIEPDRIACRSGDCQERSGARRLSALGRKQLRLRMPAESWGAPAKSAL
jgi:DNA invertase Pin-like site-specific DNA recombinase